MSKKGTEKTEAVFLRLPVSLKAEVEAEIERINREVLGANASINSWIKCLIEREIKNIRDRRN